MCTYPSHGHVPDEPEEEDPEEADPEEEDPEDEEDEAAAAAAEEADAAAAAALLAFEAAAAAAAEANSCLGPVGCRETSAMTKHVITPALISRRYGSSTLTVLQLSGVKGLDQRQQNQQCACQCRGLHDATVCS